MPHYLSVHNEPSKSQEEIEAKWIELSQERRGIWVKTWYSLGEGLRFCWWDAPDQPTVEQIFLDHDVTWEEIIEVQLTTPSDWRWRED